MKRVEFFRCAAGVLFVDGTVYKSLAFRSLLIGLYETQESSKKCDQTDVLHAKDPESDI